MWEILAGVAAGIAVAAAGVMGYRRGLRDGSRGADVQEDTPASALIKKYEAIMDYDPYGERL